MTNQIQFEYVDNLDHHLMVTKSNHHFNIEFLFKDGDMKEVYIDGWNYPIETEMLGGLFVAIGEKMITIVELSHQANNAYQAAIKEDKADDKENEAMRRELSSPYATGRI